MQRILVASFAVLALDCASVRPVRVDHEPNPRSRFDDVASTGFAGAKVIAEDVHSVADAAKDAPEPLSFERSIGERMRAIGEVTALVEMRSGDLVVGHGSGVFVSSNGDVLTAAHVVRDPKHHFRILLPNGEARDAAVVRRSVGRDVALLHSFGAPTAFAKVRAGRPARGGWVVCAGFGGEVADERVPMRTAGVVIEPAFAWEVTEYKKGRHFPIADKTSTFLGMAELAAVKDDEGRPSRAATLAPRFEIEDAKRSLFDIHATHAPRGSTTFTAVLVSDEGLAIAPSIRLMKDSDAKTTVAASDLVVEDHPGARCVEIIAVRGELALLRCIGLALGGHPVRVIESGHDARLGELVSVVGRAEQARAFGFVTAEERHPGTVAEDQPQYGCGTLHRMLAESHPAVHVGLAIAHDAESPSAGALLVDRTGHPVAIDVASRAPGLSFAVPWNEVLNRFAPWLSAEAEHRVARMDREASRR
jgi:hypothetical protein